MSRPSTDRPSTEHPEAAEAGISVETTCDELRSWLPMFDSPVAMTISSAVTMSETGAYAPPMLVGDPVVCDPHRVNLRIDPAVVGRLVTTSPAEPRDPAAVQLVGTDDRLLHRGFVSSPDDRLALRSLLMLGGREWAPRTPVGDTRRVKATGADRSRLAAAGLVEHLDSIVSDVGRVRGAALTGLGREVASRAEAPELLHMLFHLGELGVPVTVAAPVPGLAQLRSGRIDSLHHGRRGVSVGIGGCTVTIDPQLLGPTWITRPPTGPAMIEQHDVWGRCVLVVMSACDRDLEPVASIRWEHITAMLSIGPAG